MSRTQPLPGNAKVEEPLQDARKRPLQALLLVLLIIPVVVVWQVLNNRINNTDPAVSGRPLSNTQTHLHTVAMGGTANVLYLGTHYGLFISYDGGHTWPQQRGILNTLMILNIAVSPSNQHVLAVIGRPSSGLSNDAGIYFSTDEGNSWHISSTPANLSPSAYLFTVQAGTASESQFYAFYEFAGWFETRDMGEHWHPITGGGLSNMQTPSLLTDPNNPDHLFLGGDLGLYETHDDGHSWHQLTAVSGNVLNLAASQTTPRRIFCTTDQGLFRWQEGSPHITQIAHLPMSNPPQRLLVAASGNTLYALSGQDLWTSVDSGTTWRRRWQFDRGDLTSLLIDPLQPQHLYAGFFLPGKVIMSADGGASWRTLTE